MSDLSQVMTADQIMDLQFSDEYANYLMDHHDPTVYCICNGDTLLLAQEGLHKFADFLLWRQHGKTVRN